MICGCVAWAEQGAILPNVVGNNRQDDPVWEQRFLHFGLGEVPSIWILDRTGDMRGIPVKARNVGWVKDVAFALRERRCTKNAALPGDDVRQLPRGGEVADTSDAAVFSGLANKDELGVYRRSSLRYRPASLGSSAVGSPVCVMITTRRARVTPT